jgi:hypothetical protein
LFGLGLFMICSLNGRAWCLTELGLFFPPGILSMSVAEQEANAAYAKELMESGIRRCNDGRVYLDLFSGQRFPVGKQIGRMGGVAISFDTLLDKRLDLCNCMILCMLLDFMTKGHVAGGVVQTPCGSFCDARHGDASNGMPPPLRHRTNGIIGPLFRFIYYCTF